MMSVATLASCAFGGDDYRELFITSASNLPEEQLAREPTAGGVFTCRPDVGGMAPVEFAGSERVAKLFTGR
jgi:xylono-1,5-lactonase